ncbi:hypothetical protein Ocin01_06638 [Orchesella cincta]|uniref:Uncharacterized protein n=1 Tax=Orchesella cincta TaxID=48709 RepID=A0A1D2N473_ORCCI|nr:hypothetical protein Ocin01_06638 [Orchesella cincta]
MQTEPAALTLLKKVIERYGKDVAKEENIFETTIKEKIINFQIVVGQCVAYRERIMWINDQTIGTLDEPPRETMEFLRGLYKELEMALLQWEKFLLAVRSFKRGLKNVQSALRRIRRTVYGYQMPGWSNSKITSWAMDALGDERITAYEDSIIPKKEIFLRELDDLKSAFDTILVALLEFT